MNLSRRSLLIAAPAVILTPGLLMPVKPWIEPEAFLGNRELTLSTARYLHCDDRIYERVNNIWWLMGSNQQVRL